MDIDEIMEMMIKDLNALSKDISQRHGEGFFIDEKTVSLRTLYADKYKDYKNNKKWLDALHDA